MNPAIAWGITIILAASLFAPNRAYHWIGCRIAAGLLWLARVFVVAADMLLTELEGTDL